MKAHGRRPTDAEMEILATIWEYGPSTVREVHESLSQRSDRTTGQTTVLKLMQIMVEKGLLVRDSSVRPQVYSAAEAPEQTRAEFVRQMVDRVFGGSAGSLALGALSSRRSTPEERRAIRELLDSLEKDQ
ncbi:MAG TPA: BlaI/MecI/CopY family transcriptional regulator [Dehalococcoidia bacterium]|jgi:predicted transcriptional regulator